jgi:hypothetical protein
MMRTIHGKGFDLMQHVALCLTSELTNVVLVVVAEAHLGGRP